MTTQFQDNLRTFINICRARDIIPVLMTQANRLREQPETCVRETMKRMIPFEHGKGLAYSAYRDLYFTFNAVIGETGKEQDVLVIDLAGKVPQEARYMYDVVHFTAHGSRFVANQIVHELAGEEGIWSHRKGRSP
jgi:lysophospholipase L1-like esterase